MNKQNCLIICPFLKNDSWAIPANVEYKKQEAEGLATAISLNVVEVFEIYLGRILTSSYIGKGKIEEYAGLVKARDIDLIIFDCLLSPIQQRNLEKSLKCKVIDRTALILEIFGERAKTKEGRLQVELASLEYQKSRLVRSWTHLERQRGGGGFMGGPGEKQIESDKRMLKDRIGVIKKQLKKVVQTRSLQRSSRKKIPYKIVALVGYTNAGKSTLFNKLTGEQVFAKDQLFATLDPTMRIVKLPSRQKVILSDTVGFISNLPTELIAAFRATLEEVVEADVILHVMDVASKNYNSQKEDVEDVLAKLGIGDEGDVNIIEVCNKIDLLEDKQFDAVNSKFGKNQDGVFVSAIKGDGCKALLEIIDKVISKDDIEKLVKLHVEDSKKLAFLYEHANVLDVRQEKGSNDIFVKVIISKKNLGKLSKI